MSHAAQPIKRADADRYMHALQKYLSLKRDMKAAGHELMRILIEELHVPTHRAVRTDPSSFIAGVLAANGISSPDQEDAP